MRMSDDIKISLIMPVYNIDEIWLAKSIESILAQTYQNWELCAVDDGSTMAHIKNVLSKYAVDDTRIRVSYFKENKGIAEATNEAVNMATGEFLALIDSDDEITEDALEEVIQLIKQYPDTDVIYTDQDKITEADKIHEPFHKPDWSPDFFRGVMYVGHLLVVRKEIAIKAGLFDSRFNGLQDFEFMLRVSEITDNIMHLPKILYHWRQLKGSVALETEAKEGLDSLQEQAVNDHMKRIKLNGYAKNFGRLHRLRIYPEKKKKYPSVSIIIPTKDQPELLNRCLESIFKKTIYPDFEVILIDNNTTNQEAIDCMKTYPMTIIPYQDPFNFSLANNNGAEKAKGEFIIFLNNDTEVLTPEWIQNLLFYAEQPDIAAAGPMLVYPGNKIQHAGVILGFRGTADHVMKNFPQNSDGYFGSLACAREVSAVTAACMMIRKEIFYNVGCFNTHFANHYQDVDLCLKLRQAGYRIIYTPTVVVMHHECASRGMDYDLVDRALLLDQWQEVIERGDPYYNQNFDISCFHDGATGYTVKA